MNGDEPGLSLEGVINADRGEYTFSGRVFQLTTGSVVFVPGTGLDPLVQLTANYEVAQPGREALIIQIHVTGTMSEPRVSLESSAEPPLSESDLLSYLAFGRSSSGLLSLGGSGLSSGGNGGSDGIGALAQQQLASLALGAMLDEAVADIERQGSRAGFDMFRVNPADLPAEVAFSGQFGNFLRGTEIVVGKYVTPRWFVAAEGRTTTETWPGFRVEYIARGGFSWVTTWEPRYLPIAPALDSDQTARSTRAFGSFLTWTRRF
jgi:translocation and assembly module TamB